MTLPTAFYSLVFRTDTHIRPAGSFFRNIVIAALVVSVALPMIRAQEKGDLDSYKWRFTAIL
jgi:hypothetical protein